MDTRLDSVLLSLFRRIGIDEYVFFVSAATQGVTVAGSTSDPGPYAYQLSNPTAITFDLYGFLYVLDYSNGRVQKWLPGASYGVTVASGSLNLPIGMAIDRSGDLVIADTSYHRIASFRLTCRK